MPLPKKVVVLDVHPLPRNQFAFSVSKPLALTTFPFFIANVGVAFIHDLICVWLDFDTAHPHIKAVGGIAPKPRNTSLIRRPLASPRVSLP